MAMFWAKLREIMPRNEKIPVVFHFMAYSAGELPTTVILRPLEPAEGLSEASGSRKPLRLIGCSPGAATRTETGGWKLTLDRPQKRGSDVAELSRKFSMATKKALIRGREKALYTRSG